MGEVQDVTGARVLIVWDGKRIEMRTNVPPHVAALMTDMAHELALKKLMSAPAGIGRSIEDVLKGG